ncbi:MAG: hypothetical protein IKH76_05185 [Clostridiales bacterium]|nr:hypothetical protein [Clostridiales bacterium]
MRIKKVNAAVSLFSCLGLTAHVIYNAVAYIIFYYNPVLSKALGFGVMGLICIHACLSIIIVASSHDSARIRYKRLNMRTLFQRITAVMMLLLLPLHIFNFDLIHKSGVGLVFWLLESVQVLFYAAVMYHMALSFSNALVTLGLLESVRKKKVIDTVLLVTASIMFIAMGIIVLTTQYKMMSATGGT